MRCKERSPPHVIWPLARITTSGLPDLPEQWRQGQKVQCRVYVFGVIPIGVRELYFERIDQNGCRIVTRESDPLVRSWNYTDHNHADRTE